MTTRRIAPGITNNQLWPCPRVSRSLERATVCTCGLGLLGPNRCVPTTEEKCKVIAEHEAEAACNNGAATELMDTDAIPDS